MKKVVGNDVYSLKLTKLFVFKKCKLLISFTLGVLFFPKTKETSSTIECFILVVSAMKHTPT